MEKILIVGAGPAGYTAAIYTARAGLQPLLFEGLQPGGQLMTTTDIENFPGFPEAVSGPDLMLRMQQQAGRFGARFESALIERADFTGSTLRLIGDDGRIFEGRTVIVASGASARYLGLPSEQALIGRGVSACATCDGALYRNLPVAVLGGGDTAMEEALFLTRFASQVLVVHRRDA
ncbi:MAG: FAD-dependent oxidoreductase, partial [bacterium]